ncbi:DMT family transporter [Peribacillus frigoritolerans]|uniref:DMT family transporter n=1 Tax=Peribacillus frigoritolerans TaxID=450367 RepID=UPI002E1B3F58|nr:DMT family transporter [Peribacillus frigoritolerans]MED3836700.1 DMT family transporter [Peribacillus frigoritolerans]MED3849638.1 DMT family transporter [Peribacillus frigoritolerans]
MFNAAIQEIGAGQTAIFNKFVPFFGLVFSALFLNETITASQLIGFVFNISGVLFGTGYIEKLRDKKHKRINHTKLFWVHSSITHIQYSRKLETPKQLHQIS